MTEVRLTGTGGPEVLQLRTAPVPTPGPGQLLVRMQAAGVAFGDVTQRQGRNPGKPPRVLGYDVVGTVEAVGPGTGDWAAGDRVAALTMTGGYASHVLADSAWAVPVPPALDAPRVSALVLNHLTAWQMLHRVARVHAGQSVLVLGAAGGVGSALVELAQLAGATVYGTASERRRPALLEQGVRVVADASALPEPVDVVFDPVGGPSLARSRAAVVKGGVVVSFGFSFTVGGGHGRVGGLVRTLAASRVRPGARVVLYTVGGAAKKDPAALRQDLTALVELLAAGRLAPRVETLPLARAADAHRRLEDRQVLGKLVLVP
ncbi:zinc-binding dehydrogenase [Kineococcus rhizosphaerae]|nr:zinc-binding dehydrogenase [Kineococcus rhizosphaerae]